MKNTWSSEVVRGNTTDSTSLECPCISPNMLKVLKSESLFYFIVYFTFTGCYPKREEVGVDGDEGQVI